MKRRRSLYVLFLSTTLAFFGVTVSAADLLVGQVQIDDDTVLDFSLSAENREEVVGGEMRVGERVFSITGMSRLGLIGAKRTLNTDSRVGEFAVFSSSFSEQVAVGQPWVEAERYLNCDQRYNSFLAIYRVDDPSRVLDLGDTPYPILVEDLGKSDHSEVYCFVSKPPA